MAEIRPHFTLTSGKKNFSAAEKNLARWRNLLTDIVPNFGYSPEHSKTWSYGLKKWSSSSIKFLRKGRYLVLRKKEKKILIRSTFTQVYGVCR